jgi:hypothetical protein
MNASRRRSAAASVVWIVMLVITTMLLLCSPIVHSFVLPNRPTTTTTTTTNWALYYTKKEPRFTQQAHTPSSGEKRQQRPSSSNGEKASSINSKQQPQQQTNQPWQSGKSIEELEDNMLKRWGSLADNNPSSGADFLEDEPPLTTGLGARQLVRDPWAETTDDGSSKTRKRSQEFYDENDEGYEYQEPSTDNDIKSSKSKSKINIAHMIAPKPAGGRGTNNNNDSNGGGGYFFNPSAAASNNAESEFNNKKTASSNDNAAAEFNKKKKNDERRDRSSSSAVMQDEAQQETSPKPKKRVVHLATPIFLEGSDGKNPMLLTLEEATRQFESSLGEVAVAAEAPVVDISSATTTTGTTATKTRSWSDLGITDSILLENLQNMKCPSPLDVQDKACPPIITGNDVLVGTYTGSGKTLAFLAPLVQRLLWDIDADADDDTDAGDQQAAKTKTNSGLSILIVAPGRELASQIASVAKSLVLDTGLSVQLAIGGTTFSRNLEHIRKRKPDILVGTPGRIAELVVGKPGEK